MTWTVTLVPRGKSCTASNCHVAKTIPCQQKSRVRDLFKTKNFLQGFFYFFLQGRKPKCAQITGTKCIF